MSDCEIWKDIPGYNNLYQVSSLGRVKSLDRKVVGGRFYKGKIKSLTLKSNGYFTTRLSHNREKSKMIVVHQLVAMAFHGYIRDGKQNLVVDHIDGNKSNNNKDNLQIITQRLNSSKDKKNKSSQYVGVSWKKNREKWVAHFYKNGNNKQLGTFNTELEAHKAYQKELVNI